MNKGTKLTATALAALLVGAPVGALAWTGSQSNAGTATQSQAMNPATPNQAADPGTPNQAAEPGMPNQAAEPGTANQAANPTTPDQATNEAAPTGGAQGSQHLSRNTVAQIQQRLRQDGFYKSGHIDGVMGPQTHAAVMDFQRSKGLTASGQLDSQTLAALGASQQPEGTQNTGTPGSG